MKKLFAAAALVTVIILCGCALCGAEGERDLDQKVQSIVAEVIQPGMSDYDKALALHDWLCANAAYDYTYSNYGADDILFDGTGVCQAYTEAYGLLLSAAGIDNARARGSAGGGSHAWNMVRLGGRWYHVDCTWDDGTYRIDHLYFGLSDYAIAYDHTATDKPYTAMSYGMNYYYKNGSYDEYASRFIGEIQAGLDEGKLSFSLTRETIMLDYVVGMDELHYRTLCLILRDHDFYLNGNRVDLSITFDQAINVTVTDNSVSVPLDAEHFPDANFRAKIAEAADVNGDGVLNGTEINAVDNLSMKNTAISTLRGLEYFTQLRSLTCTGAGLTSLDVSMFPNLKWLDCGNNSLTSLDVTHNGELLELTCTQNSLTSLDLSRNAKLQKLSCFWNSLTALDVSRCPELTQLQCNGNRLTALDVSKNTKLTYLSCYSNCLACIDLSLNTALGKFYCDDNARGITVDNGLFDLNSLPGFDPARASNWAGCAVSGSVLTVDALGKITYDYDCGGGRSVTFTLNAEGTLARWPHIDASTFPVDTFRAYVAENFDTDNDGRLSDDEISAATKIDLTDAKELKDLQGVELFTELKRLYVKGNQLVRADLSANTKLAYFLHGGNLREVKAEGGVVDPEPLKIDVSKMSRIDGAELKDGMLILVSPGEVAYDYDCGGGFTARFRLNVTAVKVSIDSVKLEKTSCPYTGEEIEPEMTDSAAVNGKTVTLAAEQYKAEFDNNINAGTAEVTVTGMGFFKGTVRQTFTITPVKLTSAKLEYTSKAYTGKALKPAATVKAKVNGQTVTLAKGTDYTVTYKNNVNAGKATVTVKGKGNFTGTVTKTFTVKGASLTSAKVKNASL